MNIHITNLHNMGGTATLAQDGVAKVAKMLGFREISIQRRNFYDDYWNLIGHHIDGEIAKLYYGDIVIFQYPSWNGLDYDKEFVNRIKAYSGIKLIIFIQDIQKLMFDAGQEILQMEIDILNKADTLIFPSEKMKNYLLNNGLDPDISSLYQKIWEMPSFPHFTKHINTKRMIFTGNYNRFPFLSNYSGKTVIEQYDGQKPDRTNDEHFNWKGFCEPVKLMKEISNGGFGLVWCDDEYVQRYYSMNQPHKLGFNLASGIPVIMKKGCVHCNFIEKNNLGYVADSLEEVDEVIQKTSDEDYRKMIENVSKYQYLLLNGVYTKKLLLDALIKTMEN